eukprot:1160871-Pelagomonas_calceolata.AAC.5
MDSPFQSAASLFIQANLAGAVLFLPLTFFLHLCSVCCLNGKLELLASARLASPQLGPPILYQGNWGKAYFLLKNIELS